MLFTWFSVAEYLVVDEEQLAGLVMSCLATLLAGNAQNAAVFRECGGSKCVHGLVHFLDSRQQALGESDPAITTLALSACDKNLKQMSMLSPFRRWRVSSSTTIFPSQHLRPELQPN